MKKISLMIAALALVLGLSQCKKEEKPVQSGKTQHIVLTANNGNDGSKVAVGVSDNLLNLTWEGNEEIEVTGGASGTLYYVSGTGTYAIFEGDITPNRGGDIVFSVGNKTYNCMGQTGDLAGLKSNIYLVGTSEYIESGDYDVTMKLQYAVLKLDLSYFGSDSREVVTVTIAKKATNKADDQPVASVTGVTKESKEMYVAIPVGSDAKVVKETYVFTDNDSKTVEMEWPVLEANTFYTKQGTTDGSAIAIEPAAPTTPKFSVSATTTVEFAPGNLYWDGSAFKFEANQWSFNDKYSKVLISDSFEEYTVGNKIASESTSAGHNWWTTWSNAPGGSEDGVVAVNGNKCGHLTYGNDQVLLLGNEENGIYDLEFDILVPEGKNGYFNILHNFAGSASTWAMQCYLHLTNDGQNSTDAPGHGTIHAGSNGTADVPCVYDAWMHFRLHVDADKDLAEYYYTAPGQAEVLVCTWQWSLDSFGEETVGKKLSAMDFFPPENASTSEFYLDNFKFTQSFDNSHVSHFFWSKTASVAYAMSYSDGSASTSDNFFTEQAGFTVNDETGWRTLSEAEWCYLLGKGSSYRYNASNLRMWVTIEGVKGLVILPDGSTATASEITTPSALADARAVFLPAASLREGTDVSGVGVSGFYWSSTPDGDGKAYYMYFNNGTSNTTNDGRGLGRSVRLVR